MEFITPAITRPNPLPIDVHIEDGHGLRRRRCYFCGATTAEESPIAAVWEDGDFTGDVMCHGPNGCFGQTRDVLAARLRRRADSLRHDANHLDVTAANLPPHFSAPTYEDWCAAKGWLFFPKGESRWGS